MNHADEIKIFGLQRTDNGTWALLISRFGAKHKLQYSNGGSVAAGIGRGGVVGSASDS